MKRTCSYCGHEVQDDKEIVCPKCKTLLLAVTPDSCALTREQEKRLASHVAKSLSKNWRFVLKVFGLTIISITAIWTAIGIYYTGTLTDRFRKFQEETDKRLADLDRETSNKVAFIQYSIVTNIEAQFKDPRIKEIMSQVAANQASNLLLKQINPQIELFQKGTSNTLAEFNKALVSFQKDSTNALAEVRQVTEISLLIAKGSFQKP